MTFRKIVLKILLIWVKYVKENLLYIFNNNESVESLAISKRSSNIIMSFYTYVIIQ